MTSYLTFSSVGPFSQKGTGYHVLPRNTRYPYFFCRSVNSERRGTFSSSSAGPTGAFPSSTAQSGTSRLAPPPILDFLRLPCLPSWLKTSQGQLVATPSGTLVLGDGYAPEIPHEEAVGVIPTARDFLHLGACIPADRGIGALPPHHPQMRARCPSPSSTSRMGSMLDSSVSRSSLVSTGRSDLPALWTLKCPQIPEGLFLVH